VKGKYTQRATWTLGEAEREARRFNHEYIGTEHILLGLVKEGSGVAANVLKNLDIDRRRVRRAVEEIVQHGPGGAQIVLGRLPFTPRALRTLRYAAEEARNLDQALIGSGHLLLGLMREEEGVAAQILMNLGAEIGDVRTEILRRCPAPWCWRTTDVVALARGIVTDGAYDRLPILADALQDAGCDDIELLGHLQRGAAHGCRAGCWILDRLLTEDHHASDSQPDSKKEAPVERPRARRWWQLWR
jgi:hypothetical protein